VEHLFCRLQHRQSASEWGCRQTDASQLCVWQCYAYRCAIADAWADYQTPGLPSVNGDPYTGPLYGNFAALQQLKQLHPNLKVLISLIGAPAFSAAASTEAGRQTMVANCIDLFIKGNLGGGCFGCGHFRWD
jgi:chitinase